MSASLTDSTLNLKGQKERNKFTKSKSELQTIGEGKKRIEFYEDEHNLNSKTFDLKSPDVRAFV
jgi:hypothetical protein